MDEESQGCPQDRDETEMYHFSKLSRRIRDGDVQPSRPRRDRDVQFSQTVKTETRQDVQSSRPRRDRDVPKDVPRPQCRSLKQVPQLLQRNRAAAWVSFGWVVDDGVGQ